jgi:hypothetical protein
MDYQQGYPAYDRWVKMSTFLIWPVEMGRLHPCCDRYPERGLSCMSVINLILYLIFISLLISYNSSSFVSAFFAIQTTTNPLLPIIPSLTHYVGSRFLSRSVGHLEDPWTGLPASWVHRTFSLHCPTIHNPLRDNVLWYSKVSVEYVF